MASITAFPRTTLEAPWSSASLAPAALIIFMKMKFAVNHEFGCAGCIREHSARCVHTSAAAQVPPKGAQYYRMMWSRADNRCRTPGVPAALERCPGVRERGHIVHVARERPGRELGPVDPVGRVDAVEVGIYLPRVYM